MARNRPEPPACKDARTWMQERHHDRSIFAPFTGQDSPAFSVFAHAVDLYCRSDGAGRRGALEAMHGALRAMQPSVRWMARELIICRADYGFVDEIWPVVTDGLEAPLSSRSWRAASKDVKESGPGPNEGHF